MTKEFVREVGVPTNLPIDTDVLSAGFRPPTVRRSFLRQALP